MAGVFSEWRKLPVSLSELCINTTLRCGQSFRSVPSISPRATTLTLFKMAQHPREPGVAMRPLRSPSLPETGFKQSILPCIPIATSHFANATFLRDHFPRAIKHRNRRQQDTSTRLARRPPCAHFKTLSQSFFKSHRSLRAMVIFRSQFQEKGSSVQWDPHLAPGPLGGSGVIYLQQQQQYFSDLTNGGKAVHQLRPVCRQS